MELLGDFGIPGHGVKELLGGVSGVAGHKPDQEIAGKLGNLSQKIRKIHAAVQILAVGVDVLAQKGDFLAAVLNEFPAFCQNAFAFAAPLPAPDIGHDAVGAEIVAAVHDGHPGP